MSYFLKLRVDLIIGIAKGMAALYEHTPPVQHRDLKSMNVLVSKVRTEMLCDIVFLCQENYHFIRIGLLKCATLDLLVIELKLRQMLLQ